MKQIWRILYYHFAYYLPESNSRFFGRIAKNIRYYICKHIFEYCGRNVNIERKASFGSGTKIRIGDNSGIGINASIPNDSHIGRNVMMGPNCYVHYRNHGFDRVDIPMQQQGYTKEKPIIIDDDVWIGRDVTIMVGRHISEGSIQ